MKTKALLSIIVISILSGIINISYAAVSGTSESSRRELEKQILSTTVRIKVERWVVRLDETGYDIDATIGHGTVMGGRYLVTHNHFSVPPSILEKEEDAGSYGVVYLYSSSGELIHRGPLSDFHLAQKDVETLVFVHKKAKFFKGLGFTSAKFASWSSPKLEPGMEVAQVDWDGVAAHIDWVKVKEVVLDDGAPRLILDDGVLPGASGGGIFWSGIHVANNWQLQEKIDANGIVVEAVTVAALNSGEIANLQ